MRYKSTDKCVEDPKHRQFIQDSASFFRWSQVLLLLVLLTVGISHAQSSPDNPSLNTLQSVLGETRPNNSSSSVIANDTASGWPDLIVAAIMAGLFLSSSVQIIKQALQERAHLTGDKQHG